MPCGHCLFSPKATVERLWFDDAPLPFTKIDTQWYRFSPLGFSLSIQRKPFPPRRSMAIKASHYERLSLRHCHFDNRVDSDFTLKVTIQRKIGDFYGNGSQDQTGTVHANSGYAHDEIIHENGRRVLQAAQKPDQASGWSVQMSSILMLILRPSLFNKNQATSAWSVKGFYQGLFDHGCN